MKESEILKQIKDHNNLIEANKNGTPVLSWMEVGVEVIPNPSDEPNVIKYTTYKVQAVLESDARRKASDLCADEYGHLPYTTEII